MSAIAQQLRAQAQQLVALAERLELEEKERGIASTATVFADRRTFAVLSGVAGAYGLTVADFIRRDRQQPYAEARSVAMYALRRLLGLSHMAIGKAIQRDHACSILAQQTISGRRDTEHAFADRLALAMNAAKDSLAKAEGIAA